MLAGDASASGSQISQRTDPVASGRHETLPDIERVGELMPQEVEYPAAFAWLVLILILSAAGLLLASIVIKALL